MLKIMRSRRMPALFTTMLSLPKLSTAQSTIRFAALKSVTLSKLATASPPAERISLTTSSAGERDCPVPSKCPPRSFTTPFAPCLASSNASSRPMPRPAPVITATLPVNSAISLVPLLFLSWIWIRIRWLLGDFARSFYVESFLGFNQRLVNVRGHLVDEIDRHFRLILIARIEHDAAGACAVMEIARAGPARGHDQRRGDVILVLLQLVFVERDHLRHRRVGAEHDFTHRALGLADVLYFGARVDWHRRKQVLRECLAGLSGRTFRDRLRWRANGSGRRRRLASREYDHKRGCNYEE